MLLKVTAAAIILTLVNGEKRYEGYVLDDDVTFVSSCVLNTFEQEEHEVELEFYGYQPDHRFSALYGVLDQSIMCHMNWVKNARSRNEE